MNFRIDSNMKFSITVKITGATAASAVTAVTVDKRSHRCAVTAPKQASSASSASSHRGFYYLYSYTFSISLILITYHSTNQLAQPAGKYQNIEELPSIRKRIDERVRLLYKKTICHKMSVWDCIFSNEKFKNTPYECKSGSRSQDGKRPLSKWIINLLFNGKSTPLRFLWE